MARRKSRAKPVPTKRIEKLDTTFTCPFCNYQNCVYCIIDRKISLGTAICGECHEVYRTTATSLTEPIDIYSEWLDECEEANQR